MHLPRKFMNFSSQNCVIWCILGVLFLRFMCPMDFVQLYRSTSLCLTSDTVAGTQVVIRRLFCSTVELKLYTVRIADENDSDLRYSELPLKGKNKTLVKMLGEGRQHRMTPACQILEGRDPCNPCGFDAYGQLPCC